MKPECLPYVTLAQAILAATLEVVDQSDGVIAGKEKRLLLGKYSDILRPVCRAAEEAFERGFDEGARFEASKKPE